MSRRVLLIMPEFYGTEKIIKSVLEESGDEVIWINNKLIPLDYRNPGSKLKFIRRLLFFFFSPREKYIRDELNKIDNLRFDILFSINCHIICPYLLRKLKSKNRDIYSVLFLWDSFSKYDCKENLTDFNRVITFDRADSELYNIEYKPNFHISANKRVNGKIENDLCFIGKFSQQRLSIIDKIIHQAENSGLTYFILLWPGYKILMHNRYVYSLFRVSGLPFRWINEYIVNYEAVEKILTRNFISARILSFDDAHSRLLSSNVIFDLPFEGQTGFTHRVIDALANGKKLITSNLAIKREPFFDPEQIQILDLKDPVLDYAWVRDQKHFTVSSLFSDLELSAWLKSIIDVRIG